MSHADTDFGAVQALVREALDIVEALYERGSNGLEESDTGHSLYRELTALRATLPAEDKPILRTLHHFACTGGTLMSRCVAAQPNTVLLSEIDPFSPALTGKAAFAPADLARHVQGGLRPLSEAGMTEYFLNSLQSMHKATRAEGRRLVLRDHTHSHFCRGEAVQTRPIVTQWLSEAFTVAPLVTVRHPLDSFLALRRNNWVTFLPRTLEEYARRYTAFLDAYADAPLVRYEDFVLDPDYWAGVICSHLDIPLGGRWRDHLKAIQLSGDSGRSSATISPRPRQDVDGEVRAQAGESGIYQALCERLGYVPDPDHDAFDQSRARQGE